MLPAFLPLTTQNDQLPVTGLDSVVVQAQTRGLIAGNYNNSLPKYQCWFFSFHLSFWPSPLTLGSPWVSGPEHLIPSTLPQSKQFAWLFANET
jgi:hypothetical protein